MECENKNTFWQIDSYRSISQSFDFKFLRGKFSIFPLGAYMSHLDYILNRNKEFNFLECNISSINYIINRIISFLLIERFIKWLEVVLDPKKYKRIYTDDNIPTYIATIPYNADGAISFYFLKNRYRIQGFLRTPTGYFTESNEEICVEDLVSFSQKVTVMILWVG